MKNSYLQNIYRETRAKYSKFSSRLLRSQERGEFQQLPGRKQNFLISRVKRLWEKLRILEVQLKIATAGASLAMLMMVSGLSGQEQFIPAPEKNPLPPPTIVGFDPLLVDIDSDGDLDLIISTGEEKAELFLNTGSPSAPEFEKVPDEDNPFYGFDGESGFEINDITGIGDIDGDGDMDFLSREGYIVRNVGSASEPEYVMEPYEGIFWYSGTLGDIDDDGDLDFITYSYNNNIVVYENTGDESNFILDFDEGNSYSIENWDEDIQYISQLRALDFDGDGDLDLITGINSESYDPENGYSWSRSIKLISNTGTASVPLFSLDDDTNNPYSELNTNSIEPGDLDNDGDYDLLMHDNNSGGLRYYETDNNSIAENKDFIPELYDGIILPTSYFAPQFVDFDGDGDPDIFTWSYYNYGSFLYEHIDTEDQLKYQAAEDQDFPFTDESKNIQLPFFVDLDLDGDQDIIMVTYDYESEVLSYYFLDNTGSDANPDYTEHSIPVLSGLEEFKFPSFVDIDDDGDLDMFLTGEEYISEYNYDVVTRYFESTGTDILEFTERTGNNNPLKLLTEENFPDIFDYQRIIFCDVDEDGDMDVVFSGYYSIHYLENTGTATNPIFVDKTTSGPFSKITAGYYGTINLVDYDGDGDNDLFIHELYGMVTSYYENTGGAGVGIKKQQIKLPDIYPNPVADELNVMLDEAVIGKLRFEIITIDGKRALNGHVYLTGVNGPFTIRTDDLKQGYYILRIESDTTVYTARFVKK